MKVKNLIINSKNLPFPNCFTPCSCDEFSICYHTHIFNDGSNSLWASFIHLLECIKRRIRKKYDLEKFNSTMNTEILETLYQLLFPKSEHRISVNSRGIEKYFIITSFSYILLEVSERKND